MDELHCHRSFTDSGSHALYGTVAYITYSEDAGNIGFEQEWIPLECPSFRMLPVPYKVRPSQQEAALVPLDDTPNPIRARQCSDKDKHRARRHALNFVGIGAKHGNLFQMGFPMCLG